MKVQLGFVDIGAKFLNNGKGKVHPRTGHEGPEGR